LNREELVQFNQRNRDSWVRGIAAKLAGGTRILDVGAGEGRYRALFSHCVYKSQDFGKYEGTNDGLLRQSWKYGELDYTCDASSIPCEDGAFDAVLCTEVLEHVQEPIDVLREISRILRDDGVAFISAPLGSGLHQQPHHYYGGFTPSFFWHFFTELGFEVISIEPNGHFFRLLLQELHRGIDIVTSRTNLSPWWPAYWFVRAAQSKAAAKWLSDLDDEIPISEFTVGYHVEARKLTDVRPSAL